MFGELVSPYSNWVNNVLARIDSMGTSMPLIGINSSVNGNTTRMALLRIGSDVQQYRPELVMVQFGLNDANFWMTDNGLPRVSRGAFRENLIEIVDRCFACGSQRVILNTNHLPRLHGPCEAKKSNLAPMSYRDHAKVYNEEIRKIALSYNEDAVSLIDIEKIFETALLEQNNHDDFMLSDGIHLSKTGHQIYANSVIDEIVKCINAVIKTDHHGSTFK